MSTIERFRGDTAPDEITVKNSDGTAQDVTGISFRLSINTEFDPANNTNEILQMIGVLNDPINGVIHFAPSVAESDALTPGVYFYDIQAYTASGVRIKTLVKDVYIIKQDITKEQT